MTLIEKCANAYILAKHFRPLGILPVLQKVYLAVIKRLNEPWNVQRTRAQFAFRKHYQLDEVFYTMRRLVEVSIELAARVSK